MGVDRRRSALGSFRRIRPGAGRCQSKNPWRCRRAFAATTPVKAAAGHEEDRAAAKPGPRNRAGDATRPLGPNLWRPVSPGGRGHPIKKDTCMSARSASLGRLRKTPLGWLTVFSAVLLVVTLPSRFTDNWRLTLRDLISTLVAVPIVANITEPAVRPAAALERLAARRRTRMQRPCRLLQFCGAQASLMRMQPA